MTVFRIVALCLPLLFAAPRAGAETIVLRSGVDTVTFTPGPLDGSVAEPFASPFSAATFPAAASGTDAFVIAPFPTWLAALPFDPTAQWINWQNTATPRGSVLYAVKFTVATECASAATLNLHWAADERLGDTNVSGDLYDVYENPIGVYLNGASTGIAGGASDAETAASADVSR
jgi:hypothetical protein